MVNMSDLLGGVGRVFVAYALLFLLWFILTTIVMVLSVKRGAKKGQVIRVFAVMGVLFFVVLVVLIFANSWFVDLLGVSL